MEIKRCKRCNKKLKDETSLQRGYGNKCWKIHLLKDNIVSKNLLNYSNKEK